jgi:O-methyltransferase
MRSEGKDWPSDAETMIGALRLDNLQHCITDVIARGVPGDLIETGVWRGGATIFMRGVLKAYGVTDRRVWVADSFQGLPKPDPDRFRDDTGDVFWGYDALAVSLDQVKANFERYGLLDDQVRFLPGWFRDTLPIAPIEQIAVLRLDGDMYESTIVALEALYPKLAAGGYAIVDDYKAVDACKAAVDDYRRDQGITEAIHEIDWGGVFWQRVGAATATTAG